MRQVRLASGVWVAAYLRRCQFAGAFVAVLFRGDPGAGAIFIEVLHNDGADLYGPAWSEGERRFERIQLENGVSVADHIERERSFDRDLWVVSVEDREGRHFLSQDEIV